MKTPDPDRFSAELDRMLANRPVDTTDLSPDDARALEVARQAIRKVFTPPGSFQERLRQRLELRAINSNRAGRSIINRGWAPWLGIAVITLLFLNGAFNSLQPFGTPATPALATAWSVPARMNAASAFPPAFAQTARPQPLPQLHPVENPRPVPTPLAPPATTLPVSYSAADTPNGHAPILTP